MPPNEPSGLLSKVVKFVRNPTTNWSDLDQTALDKESVQSKQMLKEMVERKRRNDFVRRREFDQLRKLRQSEGNGSRDAIERPSFFQSSTQSKLEDRAGTIKKIDEIEAQMSRQWWKAKDAGAGKPVPLSSRASLIPEHPITERSALTAGRAYAATVPASLPMPFAPAAGGMDGFAPTDVYPMRNERNSVPLPASEPVVDMLAELDAGLGFGLDVPTLPEPAASAFTHDSVLDEAAIRFANGDAAGAEGALKAMLLVEPVPPDASEIWLALFDLYRATGQQDRFDTVGIDFATRFGRSGPAWFSIPEQAGQLPISDLVEAAGAEFRWACPGVLGAQAVAGLQSALYQKMPTVLQIGWTSLGRVDTEAAEALLTLFSDWANQAVELRFAGADRLETLLADYTRAGDTQEQQAWWRLRLGLLRVQQSRDAFDMVALEYCIAYEVSPPPWQDVRCTYKAWDGAPEGVVEWAGDKLDAEVPDTWTPLAPAAGSVLSGLVLGDASDALAKVVVPDESDGLLVVPCDHLMRIDFSAAGSVLNWAALQQAAGNRVQFTGLHRLTAIFFNIVGISEYAKIVPRRN